MNGRVGTHAIFLYAQWRGRCQRKRSREATVTVEDTLPKPLDVSQGQRSHDRALSRTRWAADERAVEDLCTAGGTKTRTCESRPGEDDAPRESRGGAAEVTASAARGLQDWRVSRLDLRADTYLLSIGMSEAAVDYGLQYARVQKTRS